jgi:hypothetical protein
MHKFSAANKAAIKHYVKTGDYDPNDWNWLGQNFVEVVTNADNAMREGLIAVVLKRHRQSSVYQRSSASCTHEIFH